MRRAIHPLLQPFARRTKAGATKHATKGLKATVILRHGSCVEGPTTVPRILARTTTLPPTPWYFDERFLAKGWWHVDVMWRAWGRTKIWDTSHEVQCLCGFVVWGWILRFIKDMTTTKNIWLKQHSDWPNFWSGLSRSEGHVEGYI